MAALVELVAWFLVAGVVIDGFRRILKHAFTGMEDDRTWVRFISVCIVVPTGLTVLWLVMEAIRWVLGIG